MLSRKSSPVARAAALILFLLLTAIYFLRISNEESQLALDNDLRPDATPLSSAVAKASFGEDNEKGSRLNTSGSYERHALRQNYPLLKDAEERVGSRRHSAGDHVSTSTHIHDVGNPWRQMRDEDEAEEVEPNSAQRTDEPKTREEKGLKYHAKVFGSPRGSGGQITLKQQDIVPGHRQGYGATVEAEASTAAEYGRKRTYHE